jgi:O-antigen/teichoic acid export membrane protein
VQLFLLLLLLALTYIALAPLVFHILFPKYAEAVLYTQILALAIPAGITLLVQSALKAEMDSRRLYYTQIGSAVIRTGLVATATLHFGIMGAIIAYVVAAYIEMLLAYLWFYRL